MALTNFALLTSDQKIVWSRDIWKEARDKTFINKFNPYIIKILDDGSVGREKRNSKQTERQIKTIQTRVSNIKENKTVKNSLEALNIIKTLINENS